MAYKLLKKLFLILIVLIMLFQNIESVSAVNVLKIQEKYNTGNAAVNLKENKITALMENEAGEGLNNIVQFNQEEEAFSFFNDEEGQEWVKGIDENTSVYVNKEDPTYKELEISFTPVNYEYEGEYYPIDAEIKETVNGYNNFTNVIGTLFNNDIGNEGVVFSKDNISIKYIPLLNNIGVPIVNGNQIIYPFENNTNIRYTINNGIIKEDIIYNEPDNSNEISYRIEVSGGEISLNNNVLIVHNAETVLSINAPKAYDNTGSETEVLLNYSDNMVTYTIDSEWLSSEERVYPIIIDPQIQIMAHQGLDTSVISNEPYSTIGNPDVEGNGWVLADHRDGYMYVGNNPSYGDSYSFYKIRDIDVNNYLSGKYIKKATLSLPVESGNSSNIVIGCTINGNYDIGSAAYVSLPNDLSECLENEYNGSQSYVDMDITSYIKGVVEKGKPNNGISIGLKDDSKYITFNASEYYWINQTGGKYPGVKIEYYDSPDILNDMSINDFTYNIRPMVKYKYSEGAAYFVGMGIDGKAPVDSKVNIIVKEKEKVISEDNVDVDDNFFYYPNYPEIPDVPDKWTELESNYQLNGYLDNFEENKLYDIYIKGKKDGEEVIKHTWFRLYKVKSFDVINNIAAFYGVDTKVLIEDNNLNDELITEGNLLFIREPKINKEADYQNPDLSISDKQVIDRYLNARGIQCEFGFEPINFNTGNFLLETTDFKVMVNKEEYSFTRSYNSMSADTLSSNGYGFGNSGISYVVKSGDKAVVYLFDGKRYEYDLQADNTYLSKIENEYELVFNNDHFEMISNKEKLIYNKQGYIEKIINHNNEETIFEYEDRLLKKISLSDGKTVNFKYENSLLKEIELSDHTKVMYEYDDKLNLIKFIDQTGKSVRYEYDENHHMIAWYNYENDLVVKNTYDGYGRVIKQTDGLNNEVSIEYEEGKTTAIDSLGNKTIYELDEFKQTKKITGENNEIGKTFENGLLINEILSNGVSFHYAYDENRNLVSKIRSDGFKEEYSYDNNNNLIGYINSENISESYSYDADNNLVSHTNGLGYTEYKEYINNLLVKEIDFNANVTSYEYYPDNSLKRVIYPDGSVNEYTYNGSGFVTSIKDSDNNITNYTLNERNEVILIINPDNSTKQFVYDNNGNPIKEKNERDYVFVREYDLYGNVLKEIDYNGNISLFEYDGNNNLIKSINPDNEVIVYEYDELNRIVKKTENDLVSEYIYNKYGIEKEVNDKGQIKEYFYDELGRIIKINDFNNLETLYEYDILGNKINETDVYGNKISYEYDKNNNLLKQISDINETIFTYDKNGNVIGKTDNGKVFNYEYDSRNNLVKEINPLGNFKTGEYYDGKLIKETDFEGNSIVYSHDYRGLIVKESYDNGLFKTYVYDTVGNLIKETDTNGNDKTYVYDGNNNLIQERDGYGNPTTYEYDSLNRKTGVISPLGIKTSFTYDINNNIIAKKLNERVVEEYEFDKYANLIKQKINNLETVFEYDEYDNLVKSVNPYGLVIEYEYDVFNRIIEEKVNNEVNKTYEYNGYNAVLKEVDILGNEKINVFDNDLRLIKSTYKGLSKTFEYDDNGNLIKESDSLGNVIEKKYNKNGLVISEKINNHETVYDYDIFNNSVYIKDSLNNEIFNTYDGEGNLIKKVNENGHNFEYEYDKNNGLIREKVNSGIYKEYVYDEDKRLVKEVDGLGNYIVNEYDNYNNLTGYYDERGYKTSYKYDEYFNLIEEVDPLNKKIIGEYNHLNQLIKKIDKNNNEFKYEYDVFNNVTKETNPLGSSDIKVYNGKNQLVEKINISGLKTVYEYNHFGSITKVIQDEKVKISNTYDEVGRVIEEENGLGAKTVYAYDKQSNLIKIVKADGYEVINEYDGENHLIKQTDELGLVKEFTVDGLGNVLKEKSDEREVSYTYDAFNNVVSESDAYGHTTVYEYNLRNELIKVVDALGNTTLNEYNETGELIKTVYPNLGEVNYVVDELGRVVQEKDALNHLTSKAYDGNDNLISVQNPKGYTMYYEYNGLNSLTKEFSGNSYEVIYTYDKANRLIKVKENNQKSVKYEYDQFDNLILEHLKDGSRIKYTYDALNRLIGKNNITYEYDLMGNLIKMSDDSGVSTYKYNPLNSLSETDQLNNTVKYEYNKFNEVGKIVYPDGSTAVYDYDNNGNLIKVSGLNKTVRYEYNELNQEVKEIIDDELITETSYDSAGNIQSLKTVSKGITVFEASYEYNLNNSLIKENIKQNGKEFINTYEYNENDELIKSNKAGLITDYMIDLRGNKKEISSNGKVKIVEYNEINQVFKYNDDKYSYTVRYDDNGNRISETRSDNKVKTYTYNSFNELIKVKDFDDTVYSYTYDGLGHRLTQKADKEKTDYNTYEVNITDSMAVLIERLKTVSATEIGSLCLIAYYNKDEVDKLSTKTKTTVENNSYYKEETYPKTVGKTDVIHQKDETSIIYINDYTKEYEDVLAQIQDKEANNYLYGNDRISDNDEIYVSNKNDTLVLTLNNSLSVKEEYSYDDYGNRDKKYNPFIKNNEIGYNGEYHGSDGLIYLRARYYDTNSKVFINEDSYRGSLDNLTGRNRYAYANNNPHKYVDPSGHKVMTGYKGGGRRTPQPSFRGASPARKAVPVRAAVQARPLQQWRSSNNRVSAVKHNPVRVATNTSAAQNRSTDVQISNPTVKKTDLAIGSGLSLSAASVKNTVQQANHFAYKTTVRQTGNLAARGAVKARLTYNNLKNRKFKNEGAYNPVRGSLFNKIKGVCSDALNVGKDILNQGIKLTQDVIDGAVNVFKSINWTEVGIAAASATAGALASTVGGPIAGGVVYGVADSILRNVFVNNEKNVIKIIGDGILSGAVGGVLSAVTLGTGKVLTNVAQKVISSPLVKALTTKVGQTIQSTLGQNVLNFASKVSNNFVAKNMVESSVETGIYYLNNKNKNEITTGDLITNYLSNFVTNAAFDTAKNYTDSKKIQNETAVQENKINPAKNGYYQDSKGRWHGSNGKYVSYEEVGIHKPIKSPVSSSSISDSVFKPIETHHFITDKNKKYTPKMKEILDKYNLQLGGDWNKSDLPHKGKHPYAYHDFVFNELKEADNYSKGDLNKFLEYIEEYIKNPVIENPGMLYSKYWEENK